MKIIIFDILVLIKYFLFIISISGILDLAHRKNLVQANVYVLNVLTWMEDAKSNTNIL